MTKIAFSKMHGAGNDYIFIDCFCQELNVTPELTKSLSDRHYSVGGDGCVFIFPSSDCDAEMRIFNSDGSEGLTCGNALRCVGKLLCDKKGLYGESENENFPAVFSVATKSGVRKTSVISNVKNSAFVSVDMGVIRADPFFTELKVKENAIRAVLVNAGNPHCVIFLSGSDMPEVKLTGSEIEKLPLFPTGTNVEFVYIPKQNGDNEKKLYMRVWERGSGETLACGSGACASVAAAMENGLIERASAVKVISNGGTLYVKRNENGSFSLSGEAVKTFEGVTCYEEN